MGGDSTLIDTLPHLFKADSWASPPFNHLTAGTAAGIIVIKIEACAETYLTCPLVGINSAFKGAVASIFIEKVSRLYQRTLKISNLHLGSYYSRNSLGCPASPHRQSDFRAPLIHSGISKLADSAFQSPRPLQLSTRRSCSSALALSLAFTRRPHFSALASSILLIHSCNLALLCSYPIILSNQ